MAKTVSLIFVPATLVLSPIIVDTNSTAFSLPSLGVYTASVEEILVVFDRSVQISTNQLNVDQFG